MKMEPNEPIQTVISESLGQTIYLGLTKLEHISIEFTKALLSNSYFLNQKGIKHADTVSVAIEAAKELIKQLNQDENDTSRN